MRSRHQRQPRTRAALVSGSIVALALSGGACGSRQATGISCSFEGPALAAVLSRVDAGSHDAAPIIADPAAGRADAQRARGCADASICPAGTTLLMATYAAACAGRMIACRRLPSGESIWLSGDLTRADVDAIATTIARVDGQPLISIHRRDDGADAKTGCARACAVHSGWAYVFRKVKDTWTIEERSQWIE